MTSANQACTEAPLPDITTSLSRTYEAVVAVESPAGGPHPPSVFVTSASPRRSRSKTPVRTEPELPRPTGLEDELPYSNAHGQGQDQDQDHEQGLVVVLAAVFLALRKIS